jgi:hypothetical protein
MLSSNLQLTARQYASQVVCTFSFNVDRAPLLKASVGRLPIDEPLESAGDYFALTTTRQEKTMKRMLVIMMVAVAASAIVRSCQ